MERISLPKDAEQFVQKAIVQFVKQSPLNCRKVDGGRYWDPPLVGFASGNDPLFKKYKKIIGTFHWTPKEIFELTFGESQPFDELSVISWVLPASEDIRKSNRKETKYPSLLWAHARDFGEQFNAKLRNHLVTFLRKKGYKAVAPLDVPSFRRLRNRRVGLASSWSERHVAYACGLGSFGLSDGFISPKGKAIRLGSVVTNLPLKPSPRAFSHPYANCLFYLNRTCQACAARCPAGAITTRGHDKDKCEEYSYGFVPPLKKDEYGVSVTGCGLCQTKVPCEFEIPKKIQQRGRP